MLITFVALGVDIFHLVVTRNELQNAADAGALAGARYLYNEDGTAINDSGYTAKNGTVLQSCNTLAITAATTNKSDNSNVEVGVNDVQRGHWSFACKHFTPNNSTAPVDLWNIPTMCTNNSNCPNSDSSCLDRDVNFINALQVTVHRESTQVSAWFSRILGYLGFTQSATAVAYIGFAGSIPPLDADLPIAICKESIFVNNNYSCNIGRMLNSGNNSNTSNTAGWTNFSQDPKCSTANPSNVDICNGNPNELLFGIGLGTTGGTDDKVLQKLVNCPESPTNTGKTWDVTLAVIDCPGNNVSNCSELLGAVTVRIVWITVNGTKYDDVPYSLQDSEIPGGVWPSSADKAMLVADLSTYFQGSNKNDTFPTYPAGTTFGAVYNGTDEDSGKVRWASLVKKFGLKNVTDPNTGYAQYASFVDKSVYFVPSCVPHEPTGTSSGNNFGVLAQIPVLVN